MMLFFMLLCLALLSLLVGLIKPKWVIRWGEDDNKTRKNVLKYYGLASILFFVLSVATTPESEKTEDKNQLVEEVDKTEVKNESNDNIEDTEKKDTDKKEQEEDKKIVEEKAEKEKEEEKSDTSMSKKDPQQLLEDTSFKVNIRTATRYFIEEYEKQKIKKLQMNSVAVYSGDVVKDQGGNEFPYSFMVAGRYEEKGNGALRDFIMTIGYHDDKSLEDGIASCIQYVNDDTQKYINVMDPDNDILLKIMESIQ